MYIVQVDNEVEDTLANGLKRSSSAPLINQLIAAEQAAESNRFVSASIRHRPVATAAAYLPGSSRWRRWSTSVSPVSPVGFGGVCGGGGGGGQTGWARLNRLKVNRFLFLQSLLEFFFFFTFISDLRIMYEVRKKCLELLGQPVNKYLTQNIYDL